MPKLVIKVMKVEVSGRRPTCRPKFGRMDGMKQTLEEETSV